MIAFASLFLGLVIGVVPVSVLVERPVAAVRFELDGQAVGKVERSPWNLSIDFGGELTPHELVARAFDREGRELGLARQFVNLPRPPAEVEILLERDAEGRPVAARFSGQSLVAFRPARVAVTFDDRALPAGESGRVELPAHDPEARHVLSVEVEFSPAVRSRADVVFGGGASSVAHSELTAVPVRLTLGRGVPEAAALAGVLVRGGQALPVVAVEQGPALVCVVRGPGVSLALKSLGTGGHTTLVQQPGTRRQLPQFDRDASRHMMALEKEDRLRFIWPIARTAGAAPGAQLFDHSRDFTDDDGGVHWLLTRVEHPGPQPRDLRVADATAVAGLEATASGSRRAVVLVLGDETQDGSRHAPAAVRRYFEGIRVPFFVWSLKSPLSQPLAAAWGRIEDISSAAGLEAAVALLKADLALQRIVWVEGRYLPQEITLSDKATGLEFVK
jgi:hypothetical protein